MEETLWSVSGLTSSWHITARNGHTCSTCSAGGGGSQLHVRNSAHPNDINPPRQRGATLLAGKITLFVVWTRAVCPKPDELAEKRVSIRPDRVWPIWAEEVGSDGARGIFFSDAGGSLTIHTAGTRRAYSKTPTHTKSPKLFCLFCGQVGKLAACDNKLWHRFCSWDMRGLVSVHLIAIVLVTYRRPSVWSQALQLYNIYLICVGQAESKMGRRKRDCTAKSLVKILLC